MLSENRKFHFTSELTLQRSKNFDQQFEPKDDLTNWLFMQIEDHRYSFIYKILEPTEAKYNEPFKADLAFTMSEVVVEKAKLNIIYIIYRGEEEIGTVKLITPRL